MYPLLILRTEIVCLIILGFLLLNGLFYKMGKDHGSFLRMGIYAIGHVVFDIITVLTVNYLDVVPNWFNYTAHIIFYLFAILFSYEFFCYIVALCFPKGIVRKIRILCLLPLFLYLAMLPFLPIEYLHGNGTNYSLGPAAMVGYALALLFFGASAVIITLHYKSIAPHVRMALIPMLVVMVAAEFIQIAVPELLFTGATATIITVGFFFSLENPADVFRQKLLIDALTGVKSRHSYEADIEQMEKDYAQNPSTRYGMVFCDINNLKNVNNTYGHFEGDAYIGCIAQILMNDMRSAEGIYRVGGDEFMAAYRNQSEEVIQREAAKIHEDCEAASKNRPYTMDVALGYAVSGEQYATLRDVLRVADYMMYQNKAQIKKQVAFISADGQKLNVTGLTDRIFDAFASMGDRSYLSLCNMSTNVSRWSKSAVDYFGLPGEFIFDCSTVWMNYIHPDDRADYQADINDVFAGRKKYHDVEYRVRNKQGQYVVCTCRGTILKGKNDEPDIFASTLVNHGIAESIDPITGLHNDQIFIPYVEQIIKEHTPTAFLKVSFFSFSRINLLYGYTNGNEILRQFVETVKRVLKGNGHIFRMDGPKFILCLSGYSAKELAALYKVLQDTAHQEIKLNKLAIPLRLAGGAFLMDEHFTGNSTTIRNSLSYAHERSKHECFGRLVFYGDPAPDGMSSDYRMLTCIHQDAVAKREGFYLKYQPILQMETGKVIGAEALLRWKNDLYGEIGPEQFVPWLENDPCFYHVGKWIFQRALSDTKELLSLYPDFVINVNVGNFQLEDERFNGTVLEVLHEANFPPRQLCLELTERCRELDSEFLVSEINFFHNYGIRIALDDVGTGFSSLGVLLKLPLDEIKLDKSFITEIRTRKDNQSVVRAIVGTTRSMGLHSCLEGVEDEETYQFLKSFGADSYQGYHFSKPVLIDDLKKMLEL